MSTTSDEATERRSEVGLEAEAFSAMVVQSLVRLS